ncbi:hypothetical protein L3Q82_022999 [Scortum barcoo]|uniref:Uncharacterized protein n=1 Tax=Scortum barcoo TaxID=214431 RepID=A0ACB8X0M7_9TELE|nr:hypothetical protein L3Q82_022999 [Scortum barcoo]
MPGPHDDGGKVGPVTSLPGAALDPDSARRPRLLLFSSRGTSGRSSGRHRRTPQGEQLIPAVNNGAVAPREVSGHANRNCESHTQNVHMSQPRDDDAMLVRTYASKSSKGSIKSSASIAAVNARAKAEAARAKAAFAQKEIEVRVKQAQLKVEETRLEATLEALHQERDAEAALAEATVYEAAASEMEEGHIGDAKPTQLPGSPTYLPPKLEVDTADLRTTPYVSLSQNHGNPGIPQPTQGVTVSGSPPSAKPQTVSQVNANISDLTRFLARCELLTGGLTRFSDKPGDYWAWKSSFENVTQGLHLTASEELDLLTKWLGDESSQHAATDILLVEFIL